MKLMKVQLKKDFLEDLETIPTFRDPNYAEVRLEFTKALFGEGNIMRCWDPMTAWEFFRRGYMAGAQS